MRKNNDFYKGVWSAVITPFDSNQNIDFVQFGKLLDMQIEAGIRGFIVCGTTGEAPCLTEEEQISAVEFAVKHVAGKVSIIAGAGSNNTASAIQLCKKMQTAGADALLIATPAYNKPNPTGLKKHYEALAESTSLSICLYYVPGRTAHHIPAAQLADLLSIPGIDALKEASGNLDYFSDVAMLSPKTAVLSGDDPTYLGSLAIGGIGAISVASNVFPKAYVLMHNAFQEGKHDLAIQIHRALMPSVRALFCEANPCPLKFALSLEKATENILRLPLAPVNSYSEKIIRESITTTKQQLSSLGVK